MALLGLSFGGAHCAVALTIAASGVAAGDGTAARLESLRFTRYGVSEGLSNGTVRDVLQDSRGFMWIATWGGLDRFDGHGFKAHRHHPGAPGSLSDDEVWTLFEDRDENLWVGTATGINLYDRTNDRFTRLRLGSGDGALLDDVLVYSIVQDEQGVLWMGSHAGLIRFDPSSRNAKRYRRELAAEGSRSADVVWAVLRDDSGRLWLGTEPGGLAVFDPQSEILSDYAYAPDTSDTGHSIVRALALDRDGSLWVGTQGGLDRLQPESGEVVRFRHDPQDPGSLSGDAIRALKVDRDGVLWVGTAGGGLNRYMRERNAFVHYTHDESDPSTLGSDGVYSIVEDSSGDLWIGNFIGGLHFLNRLASGFEHVTAWEDGRRLGLVASLLEDDDGTLWVGTMNGLDRVDGAGRVVHYQHDPGDPDSLGANPVLSLLRDREGALWVGTYSGGVNRLDEASSRFTRFQPHSGQPSGLSNSTARALLQDSAGTLWVGTSGGLNRLVGDTSEFARYVHRDEDSASLVHDWVNVLHEDSEGRVWIGTRAGLSRYDRATDRFVTYDALAGLTVWAICQDAAARLWVGTREDGLKLLDPHSGAVTTYRESDGLSSDQVAAILEDDRGHLWVSTAAGVSDLDPETGVIVSYDASAGLAAAPFARSSALKRRSGALLFGGENGFNSFRPGQVQRNTHVPPIAMTGFRLFNANVAVGPESPLTRQISEASEIALSHEQSVFTFEFAALSYRNPSRNRYAYRLEGFDRGWIDAGNTRTATYTNIDPGEYVFHVKGSNDSGVWNEEGASIRVVINPPFWETSWFRGAAALMLASAVVGAHLLRTRSVRRRNRLLQAEIDQRKRAEAEREKLMGAVQASNAALRESNLELEATNAELAARNIELDRFAYTVSHDLQTPLVTIRGFLGLLSRDVEAGDQGRARNDIERVSAATDRMQALLRELLALSRAGRKANPREDVDLDELVRDALAIAEGPIRERGVEVHVASTLPRVHGDRPRLLEVLQNLIENSVKFMGQQREPRIEISASSDREAVVCCVRDNGIGIEPRYHDQVFGPFDRLDASTDGAGIGLAIVKQIIEAHHGRIWIESTGEGGSTFCFALPHGSRFVDHASTKQS